MKDFFAEFRRQQPTSRPASPREAGEGPVTRVTRGYKTYVTEPIDEKPTEILENPRAVTQATRVTRENDDVGETRNLGPLCPACHSANLSVSPAGGLTCTGCGRFLFLHVEPGASVHPIAPLRPCGALVCRDCHVHSPSPHREGCGDPQVEPCGSAWYWLTPYRAIKCVSCEGPANLALVEGWVTAREDRIPDEIFKLLNVETPAQ